ncbi:unnamed protein product [Dibothriocephalus latus]|uniref:ARID domain-containing protein n=1 Tax=Dibothriocephalus latus TaxID=60516 RepID=A0A3P7NVP0_DIBLA|nr:unnamed protein product [Dibothriocephalus latus]
MDERGTPINKAPSIANKDLDLYKLFKIVNRLGGFHRVTSQLKWGVIYSEMDLPHNFTAGPRNLQTAFKKYLFPLDDLSRKLGTSLDQIPLSGPRTQHLKSQRQQQQQQQQRTTGASSSSQGPSRGSASGGSQQTAASKPKQQQPSASTSTVQPANTTSAEPGAKAAAADGKTVSSTKTDAVITAAAAATTSNVASAPTKKEPDQASRRPTETASRKDTPKKTDRDEKTPKDVKSKASVTPAQTQQRLESVKEVQSCCSSPALSSFDKTDDNNLSNLVENLSKSSKLKNASGRNRNRSEIQYRVHYMGWNCRHDEIVPRQRIIRAASLPDSSRTPTEIGQSGTAGGREVSTTPEVSGRDEEGEEDENVDYEDVYSSAGRRRDSSHIDDTASDNVTTTAPTVRRGISANRIPGSPIGTKRRRSPSAYSDIGVTCHKTPKLEDLKGRHTSDDHVNPITHRLTQN